jgi:hypothetical protein
MPESAQPGPEPNTIVVPDAKLTGETTTTFGLSSYNKPSPEWARNVFDLYFILSKAFIGWMGYTHMIPQSLMYEILGIVSLLLDPIVRGLTKMFGVTVIENDKAPA